MANDFLFSRNQTIFTSAFIEKEQHRSLCKTLFFASAKLNYYSRWQAAHAVSQSLAVFSLSQQYLVASFSALSRWPGSSTRFFSWWRAGKASSFCSLSRIFFLFSVAGSAVQAVSLSQAVAVSLSRARQFLSLSVLCRSSELSIKKKKELRKEKK